MSDDLTLAQSPEQRKDTDHQQLESALYVRSFGWPVLPVHSPAEDGRCSCGRQDCPRPAKHPHTRRGLKDATMSASQIRRWWIEWPDANVGIATGAVSGLVVVDVDPDNDGAETLKELEKQYDALPQTVETLTGGGGRHIFFQHPGDYVKSGANVLGPGLDIRADGGYIVAPRSRHLNGRCYEFEVCSHPDDVAVAVAPSWLLELLKPSRKQTSALSLESLIKGTRKGVRNISATKIFGKLLGAFTEEDWDIAWALAQAWNKQNRPPMSSKELQTVFEKIAKREISKRNETQNRINEFNSKILAIAVEQHGIRALARQAGVDKNVIYRRMAKRRHG